MANQITNYQCPACTGPLHFSSSSGKLECEYCDSVFDISEIEALYAEKDAAAAAAGQQADTGNEPEEKASDTDAAREAEWADADSEADLSEFYEPNTDWGKDGEKMRAYSCPSCGAELLCEESTAATACPYCGNPTIVPGQFTGALKPDYIIPFQLDKESAIKALKQHYRKNPFLPKAFSANNHIEEIQGVYVPFWLFDTTVSGDATFHARRVTVCRTGDYEVTTTQHYNVIRSGCADFFRVPADGSRKMPDNYMDSLEPYDYGALKPFSTAYLPGYLANRYDVDASECAKRVDLRCKQSTADFLQNDVTGYTSLNLLDMRAAIQHKAVHYALLPVWMLNTRWNGKNYLYAMNGQTGKFVGELPVDRKRFWGLTALLTVLLSVLFGICGLSRWLIAFFGLLFS